MKRMPRSADASSRTHFMGGRTRFLCGLDGRCLARSVQLYVYTPLLPPDSHFPSQPRRQSKPEWLPPELAAAALAGVVMVLILYLLHLVSALAVSGGLGRAEDAWSHTGRRNIRLVRCHHQDYRRS